MGGTMTGEGSATPAGGSGGRIAWGGWLLVSLLVIAADQFTKLRVTEALELYERVPVLPFFDLVRLHNTGAAFSFLAGASGWQNWLFTAVAVVVSAAAAAVVAAAAAAAISRSRLSTKPDGSPEPSGFVFPANAGARNCSMTSVLL